ncbi:hypothetical protein HK097_009452 [Rhizophlyctis rosea]|uniref:glutathione gamma-glutamylcysteinyltransferase n=1 Tax=Rhizophlyctis rosea TaxID=64517 RepID=A0AAD5SB98_9FUNG|nr:hypothetical protein HK097_009452 [Rhizophlyctis rosea]
MNARFSEKDNMVLVLDVARFKYPTYWVSFDLLWESLKPIDPDTRRPRGFALLSKDRRHMTKSALTQLAVNLDSWPTLARIWTEALPADLASRQQEHLTPEQFIAIVLDHIPDQYTNVVENRLSLFLSSPGEIDIPATSQQQQPHQPQLLEDGERVQAYLSDLDTLLHQLSETKLYTIIKQSPSLKQKAQAREKKVALAATAIAAEQESREAAALVASCADAAGCTLPPNLRHLSRAQSSAVSLLSMHPPEHPVNDLTAFLTMFLFAAFEYWPEIWKGAKVVGLEEVVTPPSQNLQRQGVSIREEINFIKGQIEALMELVVDLK